MGIMVGALGALVPSKQSVIAEVALRALIAGSVACFMTACISGQILISLYYHPVGIVLTKMFCFVV